jgi:hypothetical protein
MSEGEFDRQLIKAWDFYGWRYALLSALAVSGSVMPAILPVDSDLVPGYAAFYQKWTAWAKAHFDYVPYTEPLGEQVQPGCIDGYARIKDDHGFIFLFNGNPRPAQITFAVGDEINLHPLWLPVDGHRCPCLRSSAGLLGGRGQARRTGGDPGK